MRPVFVGHVIPRVLFVVTLVIWSVIEIRQRFNRRPEAARADRGSLQVLALLGIAAALLAVAALRVTATAYPYSSATFALSLVLIWVGIALRWWSFRSLGRYFTFTVMTSADQPVITAGPYRVLRHPSYTGLLLILLGVGLTYGNWLSAAALFFIPLIGFVNRILVEERALSATLGERYQTFARSRKRLIPFVW